VAGKFVSAGLAQLLMLQVCRSFAWQRVRALPLTMLVAAASGMTAVVFWSVASNHDER
jgi:hypothetical protein